jgi:hypothetical protein
MEDTNGSVSGPRSVLKAVGYFVETLASEAKMGLALSMFLTKKVPQRS